jgi:hypothetical protein
MKLDPSRWPESIQFPILGALIALLGLAFWLAPRSVPGAILTAVVPAVVGGLIWRFDGLPWTDILSWTVPLVAWIAVALAIAPRVGLAGWILGGLSVAAWFWAFIFWTRVTRWWYQWVLRKPYPGSQGPSSST